RRTRSRDRSSACRARSVEAEGEGPVPGPDGRRPWLDHVRAPLRNVRAAALLSALLAILVVANSLGNGVAYADVLIVVQNPTIQSLERLGPAIFSSYWPGEGGLAMALWRPVTTGLLGVQYVLGGGEPMLFHVVNVLAHATVTALLVLLVAQLGTTVVALL